MNKIEPVNYIYGSILGFGATIGLVSIFNNLFESVIFAGSFLFLNLVLKSGIKLIKSRKTDTTTTLQPK